LGQLMGTIWPSSLWASIKSRLSCLNLPQTDTSRMCCFYTTMPAGKKIFLIPDARAIVHPVEDLEFSSSARALLDVDRATGASRYASKYFGFMSGLGITIGAALHSMGQMLAFRDPGFQVSRLIGILSRKKVDGTQTSL